MTARPSLTLIAPTVRLRESFLRALQEFQAEGLPWWFGGDIPLAVEDFDAFVAKKLADASTRTETIVPATHLWAVNEDDVFVGRISIRHELDDALRVVGGHIGYDTVPSMRGRGHATEMLRQSLPVASALGLAEVLLTCDDANVASIRVIEKCGGLLREKKELPGSVVLKRYYWISLGGR